MLSKSFENHTDNFSEIAKSYPPEFVAKHYNAESETVLCNREPQEIRLLPKNEQHALIILEMELMYGTEYAQSVNERLKRLWEIRDGIITQSYLAHDFNRLNNLPDIQADLSLHLAQLDNGHYNRANEMLFGEKDYDRRKQIVEDLIGLEALQTLELITDTVSFDEDDMDFLKAEGDRFLDNFYAGLSESGFTVDELKDFYNKGKLIAGTYGIGSGRFNDAFLFLIDQETGERAYLIREGMFSIIDHGFRIMYSPDFRGTNNLEFSTFMLKFGGVTMESGEEVLDKIRETFA